MRRIFAGALLALAIPLTLSLAVETSRPKPKVIRGIVIDPADFPAPNVHVELRCNQKGKKTTVATGKSSKDGRFTIKSEVGDACDIVVTFPGFADHVIPIAASDTRTNIDLGKIQLDLNCKGPGVTCFEVTPIEDKK